MDGGVWERVSASWVGRWMGGGGGRRDRGGEQGTGGQVGGQVGVIRVLHPSKQPRENAACGHTHYHTHHKMAKSQFLLLPVMYLQERADQRECVLLQAVEYLGK